MADTFLNRVRLRNYKSIPVCDVRLSPLVFLVGPNGSGKSNFIDALRLTSDALSDTLEMAFRARGGVAEVRRRSKGHPTHFDVSLDFSLPEGGKAFYYYRIAARRGASQAKGEGWYEVSAERCIIDPGPLFGERHWYHSEPARGRISGSIERLPIPPLDRLYLPTVSGFGAFRPVYDALSRMAFYNLNPSEIRKPQAPDPGRLLARDGWNIASVTGEITRNAPEIKRRIEEYLAAAVPGVMEFSRHSVGQLVDLEFRQEVAGDQRMWSFPATSMSDGTLRALGVLIALFQSKAIRNRASLVGIEEPEAAIHPAALNVVLDALAEASNTTQVIVTSHSADLIDLLDGRRHGLGMEALRAVEMDQGNTIIGELDVIGKQALRDRLFTPGELLRSKQLIPDTQAKELADKGQLNLITPDGVTA